MSTIIDSATIDSYVMPIVQHGEVVTWYPTGTRTEKPEVATVIKVSHRNIHVMTALRGIKEAVRHVDDPKLKLNPEQRESGAWDFTDAHKDRVMRWREILDRLKQIESHLGLEVVPSEASSYDDMLAKVRQAGISVKGRPSRTWLESQLKTIQ